MYFAGLFQWTSMLVYAVSCWFGPHIYPNGLSITINDEKIEQVPVIGKSDIYFQIAVYSSEYSNFISCWLGNTFALTDYQLQ